MLYGAAAAMREVPAHRRNPIRARHRNRDETPAFAPHVRLHALSGERKGHEHGTRRGIGYAVALRSEARDVERLRVTHRTLRR